MVSKFFQLFDRLAVYVKRDGTRLAGLAASPDRWTTAKIAVGSPQPPPRPRKDQGMRRERFRSLQPKDQLHTLG